MAAEFLVALCEVWGTVDANAASDRVYLQHDSYVGVDFFSRWNFFSSEDPTHGTVHYLDAESASADGLLLAMRDRAVLGADATRVSNETEGRRSVRIKSKDVYNEGLFIVTLDHIPTGCGTWPAFWMYGQDGDHMWPTWGEFDIIEGVHRWNRTMTSLHTTVGCDQLGIKPGSDFSTEWLPGRGGSIADNCSVGATDQFGNQGCSQAGPPSSMGEEFNANGGGTFAAEWDPERGHFRVWFWPHGSEPFDVIDGISPQPDSWGMPYSFFRLDPETCPSRHFRNMHLVFDLSFCGDLAGPTFAQSCPEIAERMSCAQYVASHPMNMTEAYWGIKSLSVYQVVPDRHSVNIIDLLKRFRSGARRPPRPPLLGICKTLVVGIAFAAIMGMIALAIVTSVLWPGGRWQAFFRELKMKRAMAYEQIPLRSIAPALAENAPENMVSVRSIFA